MRNVTIASLLVVTILAGAWTGYFLGFSSVAGGSAVTTTVTGSLSTLGTNDPCAQPSAFSGGIALQITNRSIPVVNAPITVEVIGSCRGSTPVVLTEYQVTSDSKGWASVCVNYYGECMVTINLAGRQYPISVPLFLGGGSIVHFDLWNNSESVTPVPGTTTTTTTAFCSIEGEGFLLMEVLNSSNEEPIGSLPIHVEALYPACNSNPPYIQNLGTDNTNASRILSLSGPYNWFFLSTDYGRGSFSVNATINAGAVTCVKLAIPTGSLNITQSCNEAKYFTP